MTVTATNNGDFSEIITKGQTRPPEPSAQLLSNRFKLSHFYLYESSQRFFIAASDNSQTRYKLLKITKDPNDVCPAVFLALYNNHIIFIII